MLVPPRVPELIGGFTLYRNFAQWYAHREDLLQEQVMPGFDKFETGLANLLITKSVISSSHENTWSSPSVFFRIQRAAVPQPSLASLTLLPNHL